MITYTTVAGDTWDLIAFNLYGDVKYTEFLMSNNQTLSLLNTVVFDAGTILNIPTLPVATVASVGTPPWRS